MIRPTIGQIYSAFTAESHRVFRRAMTLSSRGILRLEDLVRAIVDSQLPTLQPAHISPSAALSGIASPVALPTDQISLIPMSNHPALEEVLERAWLIAKSQPEPHWSPDGNCLSITPACLAASALIQRGRLSAETSRQTVFDRLGLRLPDSLRLRTDDSIQSVATVRRESQPDTVSTPLHTCTPVRDGSGVELWIDEALSLWLELQTNGCNSETSENRLMQNAKQNRLRELVRRIENSP